MIAQIDRAYTEFGWKKVARRLISYGLFEGRPATTRGQWINPLVFAWLKTLRHLPGGKRVEKPIFITGLGRSGTTILGLLFSVHRDVGFLNEPKAMWQLIAPDHDLNDNYSVGIGSYRLPDSADTKSSVVAHKLFHGYRKVVGARRVVDKYPEMIFRIDFLLSMFPDAKFIFITRDGRSACKSIVKWSERKGLATDGEVEDWWGRNDAKWTCLREQILTRDPQYLSVKELATADLDHANRAALEWIVTMREGLRQQQRHPDCIIRVAYEEILADPKGELVRLQTLCGLVPDPDMVDYASKVLYDNPSASWPVLLPAVDSLFRETMTQLGYGEVK